MYEKIDEVKNKRFIICLDYRDALKWMRVWIGLGWISEWMNE